MYQIKFFFDYGSGTVLWSANDITRTKFGYAIDHKLLPLSAETIAQINELIDRYDQSMNQEYPPDSPVWDQKTCDKFNAQKNLVLAKIKLELGTEYEIKDDNSDLMAQ